MQSKEAEKVELGLFSSQEGSVYPAISPLCKQPEGLGCAGGLMTKKNYKTSGSQTEGIQESTMEIVHLAKWPTGFPF